MTDISFFGNLENQKVSGKKKKGGKKVFFLILILILILFLEMGYKRMGYKRE